MGCSQSKIETTSNRFVEVEPRPKSIQLPSSTNEQPDRIIEDCIIIWFLNDFTDNSDLDKSKLRHVISTLKTFTDYDLCMNYIINIRIERIFLIVPTMIKLESFDNLSQIEKVYVLNSSSREHDRVMNMMTSSKTFYDIDSICQQLEIDVKLCRLDHFVITASASISQDGMTSTDKKKQEAAFLYAQLMREILYRFKFENNAKSEFVNFCRLSYTNDNEQLRVIDDFERNYRPQKSLWWLTRQCFVWRILQRMQCTFEIDILYKLGFLIKHANTQLSIFQENHSLMSENLSIVYRGKTMLNENFNSLVKTNCGGLLSFGNVFTAHADKTTSIEFIRHRLNSFPDSIGILFEIHLNPAVQSKRSPCATLDKVHVDEQIEKKGIFFSYNTVFRIDSVEENNLVSKNIIWTVRLSLIDDDDQQLLHLAASLRTNETHANPLSYIGKLFMEMGEYVHAEKFFIQMLQDTSIRSQPRRQTRVHYGLGTNYMITGDYAKALEQYEQALDISLSYLPHFHIDLASIYEMIGKCYFHLNNYGKAIENYEKTTDLIVLNGQTHSEDIIDDLQSRINDIKKFYDKQ